MLPDYQFVERHKILVRASRREVWRALHEVEPGEMALTRVLFRIRTLPSRLMRARTPATPGPFLPGLLSSGFRLMAETPERELLLGISGRFWELRARPNRQPDPGAAVGA